MFLAVEADFMLVNPLPINRLLLYASLKLGLENRDFFFFFYLGAFTLSFWPSCPQGQE